MLEGCLLCLSFGMAYPQIARTTSDDGLAANGSLISHASGLSTCFLGDSQPRSVRAATPACAAWHARCHRASLGGLASACGSAGPLRSTAIDRRSAVLRCCAWVLSPSEGGYS